MTINEFVETCYSNAKKLGWTEKLIDVPEMIALIHSEASEGLESYRNNEPDSWTNMKGKPMGLASEFADIMIRIGHYAKLRKMDMQYECDRKLTYNLTRGYRHGGKLI